MKVETKTRFRLEPGDKQLEWIREVGIGQAAVLLGLSAPYVSMVARGVKTLDMDQLAELDNGILRGLGTKRDRRGRSAEKERAMLQLVFEDVDIGDGWQALVQVTIHPEIPGVMLGGYAIVHDDGERSLFWIRGKYSVTGIFPQSLRQTLGDRLADWIREKIPTRTAAIETHASRRAGRGGSS